MCKPERPSPDAYDDNKQIAPHFSKTPSLTPVASSVIAKHRYNDTAEKVKDQITALYRKHGLKICMRRGLCWAGSTRQLADPKRVKTMVLAIELEPQDIKKWWKIDEDARKLLDEHGLSGLHGICLRYYKFEADDFGVGSVRDLQGTVVDLPRLEPTSDTHARDLSDLLHPDRMSLSGVSGTATPGMPSSPLLGTEQPPETPALDPREILSIPASLEDLLGAGDAMITPPTMPAVSPVGRRRGRRLEPMARLHIPPPPPPRRRGSIPALPAFRSLLERNQRQDTLRSESRREGSQDRSEPAPPAYSSITTNERQTSSTPGSDNQPQSPLLPSALVPLEEQDRLLREAINRYYDQSSDRQPYGIRMLPLSQQYPATGRTSSPTEERPLTPASRALLDIEQNAEPDPLLDMWSGLNSIF